MNNLWRSAKNQLKRLLNVDYTALNNPVLRAQELQQLRHWAMENNRNISPSQARLRQSFGEQESQKLGHGLDFENSRLYLPGDDRKNINWRLSARAQELHVKQFNEFQQSKVFIFIDNVSSMSFGTRRRTKIAQAIRAALYIAHSANIRHCQVNAIVVEPRHSANVLGADYDDIENYVNRAYPPQRPLTASDCAAVWEDSFIANDCGNHLLVAISDFHFLGASDENICKHFNRALHAGAAVAVQITDPIERELPRKGVYTLSAANGVDAKEYDMSNPELQQNYKQSISHFFKEIDDRLRLTFMHTIKLQTSDERIDALLQDRLVQFI